MTAVTQKQQPEITLVGRLLALHCLLTVMRTQWGHFSAPARRQGLTDCLFAFTVTGASLASSHHYWLTLRRLKLSCSYKKNKSKKRLRKNGDLVQHQLDSHSHSSTWPHTWEIPYPQVGSQWSDSIWGTNRAGCAINHLHLKTLLFK